MGMIVPTIMAETVEQFREATGKYQTFARRVHIDISDGEFAPTFLLNEAQLSWPEGWEVDIHAMVSRPSEHLGQLMKLKPSMVILHAEAQEDIVPHLAALKQAGIISGDLGKFGGTASMMQLEKIRLIKKIKPDVEIGWDGGIKIENAYTITQGGVDVLNVGGEMSSATNPSDTYNQLVKEINKHGVI